MKIITLLTELVPYAMLCYTYYVHYLILLITTALGGGIQHSHPTDEKTEA